jgi:hypothetical protein
LGGTDDYVPPGHMTHVLLEQGWKPGSEARASFGFRKKQVGILGAASHLGGPGASQVGWGLGITERKMGVCVPERWDGGDARGNREGVSREDKQGRARWGVVGTGLGG